MNDYDRAFNTWVMGFELKPTMAEAVVLKYAFIEGIKSANEIDIKKEIIKRELDVWKRLLLINKSGDISLQSLFDFIQRRINDLEYK